MRSFRCTSGAQFGSDVVRCDAVISHAPRPLAPPIRAYLHSTIFPSLGAVLFLTVRVCIFITMFVSNITRKRLTLYRAKAIIVLSRYTGR